MTKTLKILALLGSLMIIIMLVSASRIYSAKTASLDQQLTQLYLRKEELISQQNNLMAAIIQLNSTLNSEKKNNEQLTTQLSDLNAQPVTTTVSTAPPQPITSPRQTVTRVTRAS